MTDCFIFDIKSYAIHDGPGIRTTVFFKGCPLSCRWCHNPEGLTQNVQILYEPERCIGCLECIPICLGMALSRSDSGIETDPARCIQCGACARICPAEARKQAGQTVSVDRIVEIISKDRDFYEISGGGITVSGGEPLMQPQALLELLKRCKDLDIHTAVDTSGYAQWEVLEAVAGVTDLFLFDLKIISDEKHRHYTGVSNKEIMKNLERLADKGANVTIRIPLIPGVNDDAGALKKAGRFIAGLPGVSQVELLPYHSFHRSKYRMFNMAYPGEELGNLSDTQLKLAVNIFESSGLRVKVSI